MIALLLSCVLGSKLERSTFVDIIELNHHYDEQGEHIWDQVIFWHLDKSTRRYQVQAWQMCNSPGDYPTRNASGHVSVRRGFDSASLRVHSNQFRESWSQIDPEREDLWRTPFERLALEKN